MRTSLDATYEAPLPRSTRPTLSLRAEKLASLSSAGVLAAGIHVGVALATAYAQQVETIRPSEAERAQRARDTRRWHAFVDALPAHALGVTTDLAASAKEFLRNACESAGCFLPPPNTTVGPDGEIRLEWARGWGRAIAEIHPGGRLGWYTRDYSAPRGDGSDDPVEELPEAFFRFLGRFGY